MHDERVNADMVAAWDGEEGAEWARNWERRDQAVHGYQAVLLEAAAISASDRVLDVGCGNGESTRVAARVAHAGSALGVDLSSRMVHRARELAAAADIANAHFEQADAQVHAFAEEGYDVVLSRFGGMFFADPVAAFANLRRATRPDGRLVMVAWRDLRANEWLRCAFAALAAGRDLPTPPRGAPGPFGLADSSWTQRMLADAGYAAVDISPVDRQFWMGADTDDAYAFYRGTGVVRSLTQDLDPARRDAALDALRATIAEHEGANGVTFGSGAWLIRAAVPSAG